MRIRKVQQVVRVASVFGFVACAARAEPALPAAAAELLDRHAAGVRIGQSSETVRLYIPDVGPSESGYWDRNWSRSPDFGTLGLEFGAGEPAGQPSSGGNRLNAVILVARARGAIDSVRAVLVTRLGPARESCRVSAGPGDAWRILWWTSGDLTLELSELVDPGMGDPEAPWDLTIHAGPPEVYASGEFSVGPCAPAT